MKQKITSIGLLLIAALLVLLFLYQNYTTSESTPVANTSQEEAVAEPKTQLEPQASTSLESENEEVQEVEKVVEYKGIHIMADGTVMDGKGIVYADAVILQNGDVQMADGTLIENVADLRPKGTVSAPAPKSVTFDVVGTDYAYDIKQIKVKKGDTVTINFRSDDGFHDWVVDEFDVATERVNEGESTKVTFVADKVGTFQYYCSVMSHRQQGMVGYLVVE